MYISVHIDTHQYTAVHISSHQYTSVHISMYLAQMPCAACILWRHVQDMLVAAVSRVFVLDGELVVQFWDTLSCCHCSVACNVSTTIRCHCGVASCCLDAFAMPKHYFDCRLGFAGV